MKALLQPGRSFGSATNSATTQRKGGLKTIVDNRPTMAAQRKLQGVVAQRVIINVGGSTLDKELTSPSGWIIASDIDIALKFGGEEQKILELDEVSKKAVIDSEETIYLQGHGFRGFLGDKTADEIFEQMKLPHNYSGKIISFNCHAGAGIEGTTHKAGIEDLADKIPFKEIYGAKGLALNHSSYTQTRVVNPKLSTEGQDFIDAMSKEFHMNENWQKYLSENPKKTDESNELFYKRIAKEATAISKDFYTELEKRMDAKGLLLPREDGISIVVKK